MAVKDTLLALLVVVIWGVNFVIIKLGLHGMPPFLLGGLRFLLVAIPAVFFIPAPKIPLKWLALYALTISFLQFAFLFCAINLGMPTGIASLVLQSQVFFTIILGTVFLAEKIKIIQILGTLIAAAGMVVLAEGGMTNRLSAMPPVGLLLTLTAGLCWAFGNITNKVIMTTAPKTPILSLVVWSALIPVLPFLLCSWIFEGQAVMVSSLVNIKVPTVLSLIYLAFISTIIGYGLWGTLLSRYETWRVTPFALLVPVVGLTSAALILGEQLNGSQLIGVAVIMLGLIINVFGGRLMRRKTARCPPV
ncbi:EamA family transporter [Acerihabitans sp. TG2]|uniref:EamA family transporter n=1 Tax=Acerihabitans sp. TG2 TaxID=3096008 RepID=UPI002B22369F|nr:EamA family transporter [Acerihabitans sp. TG2]MEA9391457.1 EamA family transporter [Acerihabitans sp. TG2]